MRRIPEPLDRVVVDQIDGHLAATADGVAVPLAVGRESRACQTRVVGWSLNSWLNGRRVRRATGGFYGTCAECEHSADSGCGECAYEIEHEDPAAPPEVCRRQAPSFVWS